MKPGNYTQNNHQKKKKTSGPSENRKSQKRVSWLYPEGRQQPPQKGQGAQNRSAQQKKLVKAEQGSRETRKGEERKLHSEKRLPRELLALVVLRGRKKTHP